MDMPMALIVLFVFAVFLAGALAALGRGINRPGRFEDRDADGEPDETPEEKRRALGVLLEDEAMADEALSDQDDPIDASISSRTPGP